MQITSANDINGDVIRVNTKIKCWHDQEEYIATITGFERYQGNVVRVNAIRDDNGTEVKMFSDSVVRFKS
jgi:hypothetical protein